MARPPVDPARLRAELEEIHGRFATLDEGTVATYIPELADADPSAFGISVVSIGGAVLEVGDTSTAFTMQSISKPFVFGLALDDLGRETVPAKVGVKRRGRRSTPSSSTTIRPAPTTP